MMNILYTSIARAGGIEVAPGTVIVPAPGPGSSRTGATGARRAFRLLLDHVIRALGGRASVTPTPSVQPQAQ